MKKTIFILLITVGTVFSKVGIIVNNNLAKISHVKNTVDTYIADLLAVGEQVWVDSTTFDDGNTRPELQQLRDSLRVHFLNDEITGAVLIGDLPCALYEQWSKNYARDSSGNVIDSFWSGENYPVEHYFMNLDEQYDTAWQDNFDETTNTTDPHYPYLAGYFDGFTGDSSMEIWVSRVIAHNLYHTYTDSLVNPISEDSVVAGYLQRVHDRMTAPATVARRAMLMGDFKNWFYKDQPQIENLNIPLVAFHFPHDLPATLQRELRRGYEWACIYEHSDPVAHNLAMDHNENNGKFWSYYHRWFYPNDRSLLQMIDSSSSQPNALFYQDFGSSNVNFRFDDCLGQMYAMLGNGLICMGSTKSYAPKYHTEYTDSLGKGGTFGQAFLYYLNSNPHHNYPGYQSLALVGAGTLKLQPYIPSNSPTIIIDSVWIETTDGSPYLIHGDTLVLHARISSTSGSIDTTLVNFKWFGVSDSVSGNHAHFILDGHNAPTYANGYKQGSYTIVLHAESPGYNPASRTITFDAWYFRKIVKIDHKIELCLNRHEKSDDGWDLLMRGTSGNIGGTADDFLFYFRPIKDSSFAISAKIKAFENIVPPNAKTGVMIRDSTHSDDPHVFMGVRNDNALVFEYRLADGGATTTHSAPGYYVGNTWVTLKKKYNKVYGYVSKDGINYSLFDSVAISTFSVPNAGFAFSRNDTNMWESGGAPWVALGTMNITVIAPAKALPVLYASDSIITLDRVQLNAATMGAGVHFSTNMDCKINGDLEVDGNAVLRNRTVSNGTMKLSGHLTLMYGATHNGPLYEGVNVESYTIPVKNVPVGTSSIYVDNNKTRTLSGGGTYKDITVNSRGLLVLNPGIYNVRSFIFYTDAKLTINGPVEINVGSNCFFDDRVIMTVSSINNVTLYTNDSNFSIGEMTFKGHIVAPNARITLRSRINYRGSIKGKVLFFDNDTKLYDY